MIRPSSPGRNSDMWELHISFSIAGTQPIANPPRCAIYWFHARISPTVCNNRTYVALAHRKTCTMWFAAGALLIAQVVMSKDLDFSQPWLRYQPLCSSHEMIHSKGSTISPHQKGQYPWALWTALMRPVHRTLPLSALSSSFFPLALRTPEGRDQILKLLGARAACLEKPCWILQRRVQGLFRLFWKSSSTDQAPTLSKKRPEN